MSGKRSPSILGPNDPLVVKNRKGFESEHGITVDWAAVSCIRNAPKSGLPDPGKADIHHGCKVCQKATVTPWPKRGSDYIPTFLCPSCIRLDEERRFGAKILNWDSLSVRVRGADAGRIVPSRPEAPVVIRHLCPTCGNTVETEYARTGRDQGEIRCNSCLRLAFEQAFGTVVLNWDAITKCSKSQSGRRNLPKTKSLVVFRCTSCTKMAEKTWYLEGDGGAPRTRPICGDCQREELTRINPKSVSQGELDLRGFVQSLGVKTIHNKHLIIPPHEIDIAVPDAKVAIEYNGLWFHTEEAGKDRRYHLAKTEACEAIGWRLLHVLEDEWKFKRPIVESRIANLLGFSRRKIGARACTLVKLSHSEHMDFMNRNHIQGGHAASAAYGLKYGDEIVASMTFSVPRMAIGNLDAGYELLRFASALWTNVPGAASRLLAAFRSEHPGEPVLSYADRRWSIGGIYEQLGFTKLRVSEPSYWYVDHLKRFHRSNFVRHKIVSGPEDTRTEAEIMASRGFSRLWDCGTLVYRLDS